MSARLLNVFTLEIESNVLSITIRHMYVCYTVSSSFHKREKVFRVEKRSDDKRGRFFTRMQTENGTFESGIIITEMCGVSVYPRCVVNSTASRSIFRANRDCSRSLMTFCRFTVIIAIVTRGYSRLSFYFNDVIAIPPRN